MAPPDLLGDPKVPLPLEVAVFSAADALRAQSMGAKRVELNASGSYAIGGTTPKVEDLAAIAPQLNIPVRIMIRPRGKPKGIPDFIYTEAEFDQMQRHVLRFKDANIMNPLRGDGFVFGMLQEKYPRNLEYPEQSFIVDVPRCAELIELAKPFACVFHRAFDQIAGTRFCHDGLNDLIKVGFDGVLTSGGRGSFESHVKELALMHQTFADRPLEIIVGGGVRPHNVFEPAKMFAQLRGCTLWMHTACLKETANYPDGELDTNLLNFLLEVIGLASPD